MIGINTYHRWRTWVLATLLFTPLISAGQEPTDTIPLDYDQYLSIVREHHPLSQAAQLQEERGAANLLKAKGQLDPELATSLGQKYFDDKQYYSLLDAGLKIPTWIGVDIDAGFDQTSGVFLNPEDNTPQGGLLYAGISIPLGQGLFIDERRAAIKEAQVFQTITETEQRLQLNDLFFKAGKAYWEWYAAYMILDVYRDAVAVSEARLQGVRQSIELGDRPPIDTLEAGIQVQNRRLKLQEASLLYENARAHLSIYLWAEGSLPMELANNTVPFLKDSLITTMPVDTNALDTLVSNHPEIVQYGAKLDQLDIKTKWQREQLKPTLNLKYNPITEPVGGNPFAEYSVNNYTWGFEFSIPILLRKERGNLRLLDVQSKQIRYDQTYKQETLKQRTRMAVNTYQTTIQQYYLYRQNRADYGRLLSGERQMFNGGESSLFMVNSRETAYISAQIQLIKTFSRHRKSYLEILYLLGALT